jgi:hypothetical protein
MHPQQHATPTNEADKKPTFSFILKEGLWYFDNHRGKIFGPFTEIIDLVLDHRRNGELILRGAPMDDFLNPYLST